VQRCWRSSLPNRILQRSHCNFGESIFIPLFGFGAIIQ